MFIVQCSGFPLERGCIDSCYYLLLFISVSGDRVRKIRVMAIKSRKTVEGGGEVQRQEWRGEQSFWKSQGGNESTASSCVLASHFLCNCSEFSGS